MSQRSPITTPVLDTALGRPAQGVPVRLEREANGWQEIASGVTNADGRVADLLPPASIAAGTYRLTFETADYLSRTERAGFYPYVQIVFTIDAPDQHYHVPLLLSPYGFSTYRGS